jgi:APA family basic amino acid/polyamine antiporter
MSQPAGSSYARELKLFDAAMVVVGGVIGAGIFRNPAIVAGRVGTPALVLGAWLLGGIIAFLGGLCFAELGARRPQAGGGYVYLHETFGPLTAFLYGWILLLVGNTGGVAAVAMIFASYTSALLHLGSGAETPLAVGAIVLLTFINYLGIKPGSITQNIFTVLKIGAVLLLTGAGLALARSTPPVEAVSAPPDNLLRAVGAALIPVLFACSGWQHINEVAAEVTRPQRTLPRALLLGIGITTACYLLANLAYLGALGMSGLRASKAPASEVMRALWGETGGTIMAAGIACSTFGFVNLVIMANARLVQAMAEHGVFFRRAARLDPRHHTPAVALVVQGAWTIVLTLLGTYDELLDYTVFGDWLAFGLVTATLFVYRRRTADAPFRTPGYPVVPALFILASAYVVASSILSNRRNAGIGTLLILAGVPLFHLWRRTSR